jgi:hypothetical protein
MHSHSAYTFPLGLLSSEHVRVHLMMPQFLRIIAFRLPGNCLPQSILASHL